MQSIRLWCAGISSAWWSWSKCPKVDIRRYITNICFNALDIELQNDPRIRTLVMQNVLSLDESEGHKAIYIWRNIANKDPGYDMVFLCFRSLCLITERVILEILGDVTELKQMIGLCPAWYLGRPRNCPGRFMQVLKRIEMTGRIFNTESAETNPGDTWCKRFICIVHDISSALGVPVIDIYYV